MNRQRALPRVATMQALACYGRCSLTIALPVLSCAGVEACPMPTALLSAHTGFDGVAKTDLGPQMESIAAHWRAMELEFDLIYIGYLGSSAKIDFAARFLDAFAGPDTAVLVDPVMGDNGRLYRGFDRAYADSLRALCARADVILPNLTEAALLLGEEYAENYDKEYVEGLLLRLADIGAGTAVLTGVRPSANEIGAAVFERAVNRAHYAFSACVEGSFHGTGDLFASVLAGGLAKGLPVARAVRAAVEFTVRCIEHTHALGAPEQGGVLFEPCLGALSDLLRG